MGTSFPLLLTDALRGRAVVETELARLLNHRPFGHGGRAERDLAQTARPTVGMPPVCGRSPLPPTHRLLLDHEVATTLDG